MHEEFNLEPGERITKAVRKHWFVFFLELLPFAILAVAPLIVPDLLSFLGANRGDVFAPIINFLTDENPFVRFLLGLYWLVLWICAFNLYTSYFLNQWIITTHRIIEIEQRGFFSREVSSLLLNRVQDVTTDVHGFFPTIVGYGTLIVQSAGTTDYFSMRGIPDATGLRDLIMKEIADLRHTETGV
ncbi:MAG: PH domain-containing protein [Candidatus Pacebacteria bacterium]|nr:PH domain-containing protein [Candidatus Paceibacterota bacterium]